MFKFLGVSFLAVFLLAGHASLAIAKPDSEGLPEGIDLIIQEISDLQDAGTLNKGRANALIAKLKAAGAALEKDNPSAENILGAFINQVNAFISAGILPFATGQALVDAAENVIGLPLYDDFNVAEIDESKWSPTEFVREINAGKMEFAVRGRNFNVLEAVNVIENADDVAGVAFDVIIDPESKAENIGVSNVASFLGFFYNANSSSAPDLTGDVGVFFGLSFGAGETTAQIVYDVFRCDDSNCSTETELAQDTVGSVNLGTSVNLNVTYDGDQTFDIYVDRILVASPSTGLAPKGAAFFSGLKQIGVDTDGGPGAFLRAAFDNVEVDTGSGLVLHDDFSAIDGRIDLTKWQRGEFVREIDGGALRLVLGRKNSQQDINTNFTVPGDFDAMEAEVTLETADVDVGTGFGGSVRFIFQVFAYNAVSAAPTDRIGDVFARITVWPDHLDFIVFECSNPRCSAALVLTPGAVNLGPNILGTTHKLFIEWDAIAQEFIYRVDDNPLQAFDPVAAGANVVGPPLTERKTLRLRASPSAGSSVFAEARVDSVRAE